MTTHTWDRETWTCANCGVPFSATHNGLPCDRVVDEPVVEAVPVVDWSTVNRSFSS